MQVLPAVDWPPSLYRLRIPLRQALSQRSPQLGSPVDPWLDLVCAGRGTSSNSTLSSLNRDGSGGEPPAPQGYVPGEVATAFLQRTQKSGRILSPCSGIQKGLGLSLRKRFGCVGILSPAHRSSCATPLHFKQLYGVRLALANALRNIDGKATLLVFASLLHPAWSVRYVGRVTVT
jgi:hypothetical protein